MSVRHHSRVKYVDIPSVYVPGGLGEMVHGPVLGGDL